MPYRAILDRLSAAGFRRTRTRQTVLRLFADNHAPLSVPDLLSKSPELAGVNKTTLYREVDFLSQQNILVPVHLGDGKTSYELAGRAHHHHLICEDCGRVDDVTLTKELEYEQARLAKLHHFSIRRHALEFFGRCANCQ